VTGSASRSGPALGVVFRPQLPPERLRSVALTADTAGLDELWLWEDCFREAGISAAAAALAWTSRVRVGIGLLPVPFRNVAIEAMEAATMSRLFPDRILFGIGHGVQEWMAQVGARVDSPMTLLREHASALRSLLAGERVTTDGRYVQLDDVALDWPPPHVPPLIVGAVGPRTIELSGELGDGTLLTGGTTPDTVRQVREQLDAARAAAGVDRAHSITVYVMAATGADAAARMAAEVQRWDRLDPASDIAIAGSPVELAEGLMRWVDAGADSVVLQPTEDEPDLEGFIDVIGRETRPLLSR
jgi:alkanesulfonate monooxygenase SsuD/methylene tetrahydromethanopterin reductase-like flavin-dependent oxidoreductase (luciferase family)